MSCRAETVLGAASVERSRDGLMSRLAFWARASAMHTVGIGSIGDIGPVVPSLLDPMPPMVPMVPVPYQ